MAALSYSLLHNTMAWSFFIHDPFVVKYKGGFLLSMIRSSDNSLVWRSRPLIRHFNNSRYRRSSSHLYSKGIPFYHYSMLRRRANGDSFKPSEASTTSNSSRKSKFLLDKGNNENKIDCLKYGHILFPLFHCKCSLTAIWPNRATYPTRKVSLWATKTPVTGRLTRFSIAQALPIYGPS